MWNTIVHEIQPVNQEGDNKMSVGKKYVFIFVLCSLTTALHFSNTGAQETSKKKPQITIDAPNYDFGEIHEGDKIIHDFTIKNTGTAELTIKDVKPG